MNSRITWAQYLECEDARKEAALREAVVRRYLTAVDQFDKGGGIPRPRLDPDVLRELLWD